MTNSTIKILLIDDHALFRSGLKFLLETEKDFEIVGEAQDGLQGVKLANALHPDVVLLDLDMPVMAGKETLQQLLNADPKLNVLILTVSEDDDDLLECMKIGAKGYLLKNIDTDFLLNSIRKTLDGDYDRSQLDRIVCLKHYNAIIFLLTRPQYSKLFLAPLLLAWIQ